MSDRPPSEFSMTASPQHMSNEKPAGLFPFLVTLGILGILCIGPTLSPYGHLSYAYLRSLFFDGDLNIIDEAKRHHVGWPTGVSMEPDRGTGLPASPASAGPGLFWAPFLCVAHILVVVLRALGLPLFPDGYNQFYYLAINIGTFFYLVLGGALTVAVLQRLHSGSHLVALVLAGTLASPLLAGSLLDGSLPDAMSFFGAAFFFFEWVDYRRHPRLRNALMLGIAGGILCLIRSVNIVLCPWPLIDLLRRYPDSKRSPYWKCLWYVVALAAAMTPQLLVWHAQHGEPWPRPQDRFQLVFHPGAYFLYLFSWPGGLIVRYPFFALGFFGLIVFARRERRLGAPLLLSFLASVLAGGAVTASWFQPDEAPRFAVSAIPFAAFGVSCLWGVRRKVPASVAGFLVTLLVLWAVFCDLLRGSFSVFPSVPAASLMIPRQFFDSTATFDVIQALAVVFLAIVVGFSLLVINRIYRDITDPSADLLFAHPGRRIGILAIVILSADLIVCVADWSHYQVLLPVHVGRHTFRVTPYAYNRFSKFKEVGLNLEIGPGTTETLYLSPSYAVSGIYVVTRVSSTRHIPRGASVARVSVDQGDRVESVLLEFGEETISEESGESEKYFQATAGLHRWLNAEGRIITGCSCRLDLPRPVIAKQMMIENLVADATLTVDGLGLRPSPIRVVSQERLRPRRSR